MLSGLTQFGADSSSSGLGSLGISLSSFLIQLVTFLLAYLVLRKYAFGPILKVLKERRDTIENGVALGEQMKREKAELEKTITKTMTEARAKADQIVSDAQTAAREALRSAEDDAQAKAAGIIKEGQERGEQEVARARKALQQELVGLISDATETIIDEKVDATKDAQLIDRALQRSNA